MFINSTVNGQISFIATVYPETFLYDLVDVATADFNGDGKPDIVVGGNGFTQTIAVYTNSTMPGSPVSFLTHKVFPVQADITGVLISDIDVDGKPDVITLRSNGNAHVFRNISTLNSINFESPVAISLTPSGGLAENFLIADFNGDDKPDIGVANYDANGISFFKNNSSSGSIAFLPRQYITTGDWNLSIAAGDIDGDSKPDIAITNKDNKSVSVLINISSNTNISFNNKIDFPINVSPTSISIADIDGNGKPDVITGNNIDQTISILLSDPQKVPSIITFPPPVQTDIGPDNILNTGATSNNTETPIVYTSSDTSVAIIRPDGQIQVIGPGTTTITASQPASANFLAATPVFRPFEIKQYQSIAFPAIGPKLICDADFSANASSGTPMPIFYSSSNPAVATISGTGVIHIVGTGSTTITVTQPGNNLYNAAAPQSQVLTVSFPPTPTATINASTGFPCAGSSVTFTANVFDAGSTPSYEWLRNGSVIGGNSAILIVDDISASDLIQCKITPSISCGASPIIFNKLNVNVQSLVTPTVSIHVTGGQTCQGSAVSFYATPTNPGANPSYSWYVNNKLADITSVPAYTYTALVNGDKITCMLINNSAQCLTNTTALSNEVAVTIITPIAPQVSIAASANNVYAGTPITFTASTQASIANYQWRINGVNTGINAASFRTTSLKNGDEVTCAVTPDGFCVITGVSSSIVMDILKPIGITIPNAFSPNGDGINDVWEIGGLADYTDYVLKVFNRNGMLLFQSKGYTQAWDGLFNGKKLPTGTYYYLIDTPLSKDRRSGNVTILR
ncbi:FG-GAP-like repeat-containing protein [Mucilaginibacter sp. HD30]